MLHRFLFQRDITPRSPTPTNDITELVTSYATWLSTSTQHNTTGYRRERINEYIRDALRTVRAHGQEFSTFAPFRPEYSALQTMRFGQVFVIGLLALSLVLGLHFYGIEMFVMIMAVVTVFYFGDMLFFFWLSVRALHASAGEQIDDEVVHALADADWPLYTVLCPLYHEAPVVPQFVKAMQNLDYPTDKLQILLLLEEDDTETHDRLKEANLPPHFSIVMLPAGKPRTKPRSCNYGLLQATGDYVVIYDAEDIPDPLQLKKAVLTFANHGPYLACVQAEINVYNGNQNLLTRWFSAGAYQWFDAILPGLQSMGLPIPLGGTSNHFRAEALRAVDGWDAFNVTEDCDLGLRLAHYGLKTVMLDSTTYEEANSQIRNWFRQRSRWIKGYMQTYLVNMRQPLCYLHPRRWPLFLSLQYVVGIKTGVLLVNPVMWVLLAIYVLYRPVVEGTYHTLFPTPVLYMGMFSLIFGNFFCLYSCIVSCLKHRQYGFIKWTLLFPIYWAMMSMAAYVALFELIFKPHYWRKTQHGLHLRSLALSTSSIVGAFTYAQIVSKTAQTSVEYLPMTSEAKAHKMGEAVQLTSSERGDHRSHTVETRLPTRSVKRSIWKTVFADPWLIATCVIACVASIVSLCYFFQGDQILAYRDAYSHMLITPHIFDNATPGFAQLGGAWFPLPHLLMLPFIWNDYLWHTGLAGSFPSMLCYNGASVYLFLTARRLTKDSRASFVGTLLFVLNPNILYLQATPLSELALITTMMMACYHFLVWAQDDASPHLILAALGTFLATLSGYDAWFLLLAFLTGITAIGLMKHQRWVEIEGRAIAFGTLGGLGITSWFLWDLMIFGGPLHFQSSPFPSQAVQDFLHNVHILYTYHNLWQPLYTYVMASIQNVGPITSALAVFAFFVFIVRYRFSPDSVAGLMFTIPVVFYVISPHSGQAPILLSPVNRVYNARYGVEAVVPAAFFVATLAGCLSSANHLSLRQHWSLEQVKHRILAISRPLMQMILTAAIIAQAALTTSGEIISSQGGQYSAAQGGQHSADCTPQSNVVTYLAQHYTGGKILEDFFVSRKHAANFKNISSKNIIYEGSGLLWKQALKNPASLVDWVVLDPIDKDDLVAEHIHLGDGTFLSQFIAVAQDPSGLFLFHRKWLPLLPTQTMPSSLLNGHSLCGTSMLSPLQLARDLTRPDFQTGMVFPQWSSTGYGSDDTRWLNGLQEIYTQTGAGWIELTIIFHQAMLTSTQIVTGPSTPTPTALAEGIRAAHAMGYRVFVAPLLTVDSDSSRWSGYIQFSTYEQEQQWFDNYWHAFKPYVEVAAQEGVEQLAIGTEYEWLEEFAPNELWNTLIARVRSIFPGTITYNMNWSTLQVLPAAWMHNANLGMIGVSTYIPLTETPVRIDPRQIFDLWRIKVKSQLDTLSIEVGKPVLLSELGFRNSADMFYHSWEALSSAQADPEEQAYACDAALASIIHDPHISGVFFWGWDDVGLFRLRSLQSSVVIHSWYASLDAG